MTSFWKTILGALITGAIIAGGSGLVLSKVTAAEVTNLKDTVSDLDERDRESSQKLASVETTAQATKDQVQRIEEKLDRLLDRVPQPKR